MKLRNMKDYMVFSCMYLTGIPDLFTIYLKFNLFNFIHTMEGYYLYLGAAI